MPGSGASGSGTNDASGSSEVGAQEEGSTPVGDSGASDDATAQDDDEAAGGGPGPGPPPDDDDPGEPPLPGSGASGSGTNDASGSSEVGAQEEGSTPVGGSGASDGATGGGGTDSTNEAGDAPSASTSAEAGQDGPGGTGNGRTGSAAESDASATGGSGSGPEGEGTEGASQQTDPTLVADQGGGGPGTSSMSNSSGTYSLNQLISGAFGSNSTDPLQPYRTVGPGAGGTPMGLATTSSDSDEGSSSSPPRGAVQLGQSDSQEGADEQGDADGVVLSGESGETAPVSSAAATVLGAIGSSDDPESPLGGAGVEGETVSAEDEAVSGEGLAGSGIGSSADAATGDLPDMESTGAAGSDEGTGDPATGVLPGSAQEEGFEDPGSGVLPGATPEEAFEGSDPAVTQGGGVEAPDTDVLPGAPQEDGFESPDGGVTPGGAQEEGFEDPGSGVLPGASPEEAFEGATGDGGAGGSRAEDGEPADIDTVTGTPPGTMVDDESGTASTGTGTQSDPEDRSGDVDPTDGTADGAPSDSTGGAAPGEDPVEQSTDRVAVPGESGDPESGQGPSAGEEGGVLDGAPSEAGAAAESTAEEGDLVGGGSTGAVAGDQATGDDGGHGAAVPASSDAEHRAEAPAAGDPDVGPSDPVAPAHVGEPETAVPDLTGTVSAFQQREPGEVITAQDAAKEAGILPSDSEKIAGIIQSVKDKFGVDLEIGVRTSEPMSAGLDVSPKPELIKPKAVGAMDLVLGAPPDAAGTATVYNPVPLSDEQRDAYEAANPGFGAAYDARLSAQQDLMKDWNDPNSTLRVLVDSSSKLDEQGNLMYPNGVTAIASRPSTLGSFLMPSNLKYVEQLDEPDYREAAGISDEYAQSLKTKLLSSYPDLKPVQISAVDRGDGAVSFYDGVNERFYGSDLDVQSVRMAGGAELPTDLRSQINREVNAQMQQLDRFPGHGWSDEGADLPAAYFAAGGKFIMSESDPAHAQETATILQGRYQGVAENLTRQAAILTERAESETDPSAKKLGLDQAASYEKSAAKLAKMTPEKILQDGSGSKILVYSGDGIRVGYSPPIKPPPAQSDRTWGPKY